MLKPYTVKAFALIAFVQSLQFFNFISAQKITSQSIESRIMKDARVEKVIVDPERLTPTLIRVNNLNPFTVDPVKLVSSYLEFRSGIDEFKPLRVISNKNSVDVEKIQQYFKGIKVEHGKYSILKNAGSISAFTGEFYKLDAGLSTSASITETQALNAAKQYVAATEYSWEQIERAIQTETNPSKLSILKDYYDQFYPKAEMVIVQDFFDRVSGKPGLAYKFNIYAANPVSRGYVFVNAHTGKIMYYDKIIKHLSPDLKHKTEAPRMLPELSSVIAMSNAVAEKLVRHLPSATASSVLTPLPTRYADTRMMGTKLVSGNDPNSGSPLVSSHPLTELTYLPGAPTYVLIDDTRGGGFETYDLNGIGGLPISLPVYGQGKSFTDVDNNWTLAEHNRGNKVESENDDFAFDAHWGAGVVYDYWDKQQGRKSFDNENGTIKSYIHSGIAYDNAFWNGSVMTYGDGSFQGGRQAMGVAPGFMPLTSLDVCGHEIGHGVCSFTSDLAYQNESGAMNEGFSDIWAACIENFALDSIDATLISNPATRPNGFKIWSIGEQIDANDAVTVGADMNDVPSSDPSSTALRYMDDPNKAGDPGSYWETGTRFQDPECTPTLANDQCGVHTNSGVLNHWFYYLVTGGSGTVNTQNAKNTTGALNGQPFNTIGMGFQKAEKLAYLMEQLLPSNAKFIDARNLTLVAAEILYGKCSNEWKQAITSWHAVAVGSSSDTAICASLPKFSVAVIDSISEASAKNLVCDENKKIITMGLNLLAPGQPTPVTVTITPSGTATQGKDYQLQATNFIYNSNEAGLRQNVITIYNDGEIETDETIILNIHAQSADLSFVKDTVITIVVSDDDGVPLITTARRTLLNEDFNSTPVTGLPAGWVSIDEQGNSTMKWRVGPPGLLSRFTTNSVMADENDLVQPESIVQPTYPLANANKILLRTPLIDATSLADIHLVFSWSAMGEPDPAVVALDYGDVLYSTDGVNFQAFQFDSIVYAQNPLVRRDSIIIPAQLNNQKFYIGFRWFNDDNLAVPPSFHLDDIVVTAAGNKVESDSLDGVGETQYAAKDIYFKSARDMEVIARIRNNPQDLGCVVAQVTSSGNGPAQAGVMYNSQLYSRSKKLVSITSANTTSPYELTLYYTVAELQGMDPMNVKIMKVKDGVNFSGTIAQGDAVVVTPSRGDSSSNGYYTFTANFVGFSQFALVSEVGPLPVTLISFTAGAVNNEYIKLSWSTAEERGINQYGIERAIAGTNFYQRIGNITAYGNQSISNYDMNDRTAKPNTLYQYRIRIEENSRTTYSEIRTARIAGKGLLISIRPNPSDGKYLLDISGYKGKADITVTNVGGQTIYRSTENIDINNQVLIDISNERKGVYMLRVQTGEEVKTEKLVIQ